MQKQAKKSGYARFVRSIKLNLGYWREKIEGASSEQLRQYQNKFLLVCRAVRLASKETETAQEAAQFAISAFRFAEQCNNWSEWVFVLSETLVQNGDADPDIYHALHLHIGTFLRLEHKYDASIEVYEKVLHSAELQNDFQSYAKAIVGLAACYLGKRAPIQVETYLTKENYELVLAQNDARLTAQMDNNLGHLHYFYKGNLHLARRYFEQALANYKKIDASLNHSRVLHNLGTLHINLNELEKAIAYLQEARELQIKLGVKIDAVKTTNSLGTAYYVLERWQDAASVFRSIDTSSLERAGYVDLQATNFNNLGNVLIKQREFSEGRAILKKSAALWEELGNMGEYANVIGTIGESYAGQGKLATAIDYLDQAIQLLEDIDRDIQQEKWFVDYRQMRARIMQKREADDASR